MKLIKTNAVVFCLLAFMSANFALASDGVDDVAQSSTRPLPERHRKVSSQLFVGTQKNQALIVSLGGSEGGNPWASNYWKAQREKFLAQGYAVLALGYFGTKDSPEQLDRISLDAVHEAVMDATKDPLVNGHCIALTQIFH